MSDLIEDGLIYLLKKRTNEAKNFILNGTKELSVHDVQKELNDFISKIDEVQNKLDELYPHDTDTFTADDIPF